MFRRAVAAIGDPNDINCWSNIPYFFLQAGKRAGFLDYGIPLNPGRQKYRRIAWNLAAPLRWERPGGFQYTRWANESLLRQHDLNGTEEVISHFQLFPPHELCIKLGIKFSHYIDFPLSSLFDDYKIATTIGKRVARQSLTREREQYLASRFVVCMSPWAARQVVERYGIPKGKVHSITPGANLPEKAFDNLQGPSEVVGDPPDGKGVPLRIAFVGKLPLRKGLDRLVNGVRILRQRGYKTIIRVIGPKENLFPDDVEVEHVGFINKLNEPVRLIKELQACHIGALPSYHEAFGIAALEYLRCGLPALITRVGGLGESIPPDCGIILPADCSGDDIADALEELFRRPDDFQQLRARARIKAKFASWDRTIQEFQGIWRQTAC
jgi:glycosyltransferase involved in cell wall biosynthesis